MKKKTSKLKPSLEPQQIDRLNWYYETKMGIEIIHEVYIEGELFRTEMIEIPKKKLNDSLKRINGK